MQGAEDVAVGERRVRALSDGVAICCATDSVVLDRKR